MLYASRILLGLTALLGIVVVACGSGVNVTEVEPTPKDSPLFAFDNVLITPHMAAFAQESTERSRLFAVNNTTKVAMGQDPDSIVLPD